MKNDLKYLRYLKNKPFNPLNDYFMRYILANRGHEHILKDLINSVRIDAGQEPFEEVEVINTFNLKEAINDKESIVDVMAVTKSGESVLIEIQRSGNKSFVYRCLYYWAKRYVSNLRQNEKYKDLKQVIIINILDFTLIDELEDASYLLCNKRA